jgi:hypothetical protein
MSNSSAADAVPASQGAPSEGLALGFALTILTSAFLLFQVQPLISKFILPWFGGSPAVWTTCLLFFQTLLFGGYAYAHFSTRWLSARWQAVLHITLLALALALLPIAPERPPASSALHPTREVLALLARSVGLPYFVLSSTGPLVQGWFSQAYPGRSPYRLYALSNLGSLVALVSYPFVFEPAFSAPVQARLWSWLFGACLALLALGALSRLRLDAPAPARSAAARSERDATRPTLATRALWLALPAFASALLLATTNHVCENVAVVPFLWVAPLGLYLLSFIIAFDARRWYARSAFAAAGVILALAVGCVDPLDDFVEAGLGFGLNFVVLLVLDFSLLFAVCMTCHGELVRRQPAPAHLTEFYLLISAGGALGGVLVSLVCPALFSTFLEWTLGLLVAFALALGILLTGGPARRFSVRTRLALGVPLGALGLAAIAYYQIEDDPPLEVARNFYGVVSAYDVDATDPAAHHYSLTHGVVVHGRQFRAPDKQRLPLAYYSPEAGVGRALAFFADEPELHVGAVGLGVGTIATYARPGQRFRFYEINPEVRRLAKKYFTYLSTCPGVCEVVMGDARLSLEHEEPQGFHLLVLDAFSGDAVPAHLLTEQAFSVYLRHLRADGVIAVNITNHQLDLAPVLAGVAARYGLGSTRRFTKANAERMLFRADWVLLSKNQRFLAANPTVLPPDANTSRRALLWTDDYSNLFQLLK